MGKRKIMKPGASYKGFRLGITPKRKANLQYLDAQSILTSLQHDIVQETLDKCILTKKVPELTKNKKVKKDKDGKDIMVDEIKIIAEPHYIARLFEQLEKPFNEAKVDHLGNPWEKPKELTKEEIAELNKKAIAEKNKDVVVEDEKVVKKLEAKNKE